MGWAGAAGVVLAWVGSGQTNLQETSPLIWVMVGISITGSIVTFAFLVYSVWKWWIPRRTRGRMVNKLEVAWTLAVVGLLAGGSRRTRPSSSTTSIPCPATRPNT